MKSKYLLLDSKNAEKSKSIKKLDRLQSSGTTKKVNFFGDENIIEGEHNNTAATFNISISNDEDDDDDEIWKNFDIGTLDFNKFIDSNYMDNDESNKKTKFPQQLPMTSAGSRKKRTEMTSDDDLAEIKSKRRVRY